MPSSHQEHWIVWEDFMSRVNQEHKPL
jgi:hypothetical protein